MIVSLELFKKHVRADDFDGDDVYLQHLLDAAEEYVIRATYRKPGDLSLDEGTGITHFPHSLEQAIMMLAAHWYNQRESVGATQMHEVPSSVQALIKPFRKLVNDASGTNEI